MEQAKMIYEALVRKCGGNFSKLSAKEQSQARRLEKKLAVAK